MIFVLNHLLSGALGMSWSHILSQFPLWVPLAWGESGRTLQGKKPLRRPPEGC